MREILFRGKGDKRYNDGEWCFGVPIECYDGDWQICTDCIRSTVITETVGQYTGLKDKNGNKIFEGDIVRLTDEHNEMEWTAVVVFGNPNGDYNWGWQLNAIEEFDGNKGILLWVDMEESGAYCEIIGNIYDNPELMEGADNG